jgi:oxygen-independent coproporphyrinogen-3 oxidase
MSAPEPPPQEDERTQVGSVFVSNYPPYSSWQAENVSEAHRALAEPPRPEVPLGLYLHIPFCRRRCKFCYFRVFVDKNADEIQSYLDALAREVELLSATAAVEGRPLKFIYFGGGTPSYVAIKHLRGLLDRVQAVLPWDQVEEVTFECEPGTLTEPKVAAYRELGITRLSLGIEHFDDEILRDNGRAHVSKEIYRVLPWIRAQEFPQLNVDLIAGMVGDNWDSWRETVKKVIDVDADSVTIYQMELPYNTVYSQGILEGDRSPVANWETKRAWNDYAIDELTAVGYEVSSAYTLVKNRGQKASRFVYRDALWHGADMLGTGVASFGHMSGVHVQNAPNWSRYLEALGRDELPIERARRNSDTERLTRELILQMKLGELDLGYFRKKFEIDPYETFRPAFERLVSEGFVDQLDSERVRLTRSGLLQVDSLLPGFYDEQFQNARYT